MSAATIEQSTAGHLAAPLPAPSPALPELLALRGVGLRYAGTVRPALESVDLHVRGGERIALLGPSGGGKTTLLRLIEGSLAPTAGAITRAGRAALIYQDLRLVPERTALDNVCMGALGRLGRMKFIGRWSAALRAEGEAILADLGLAALSRRPVATLSGGQRQRVAIGRALMAKPALLLADEPLSALDEENAARTLALLASLQQKHGFALLLSIHHPSLAPGFFTRAIRVTDGRVEPLDRLPSRGPGAGPALHPDEAHPVPQDRGLHGRSPWAGVARLALALLAGAAALAWAARGLDLRGAAFGGMFGAAVDFLARLFPASLAEARALPWSTLAASLLVTIQMALLGTAAGLVLALPLAVLGSRAAAPAAVRWPVRGLLNLIRTVPSIIWALFMVAIVGLGPVAGVLALALYSLGYLTKFFYEAFENADAGAGGALRALGASRGQAFLLAVLPAARPALVAAALFMLEYNIRSASVLGVVGAGGIGQDLMYYIEWRQFAAAAAGLAMILIPVVALDALSQAWRERLVRRGGA